VKSSFFQRGLFFPLEEFSVSNLQRRRREKVEEKKGKEEELWKRKGR